jgi:fucose permease
MPPPETSRTRSAHFLNVAAHAAFVPTGAVTVILGPLLPALSLQWSMNYAQAGSLFTAQFVGGTVGATLSGMVCSRLGFRFAINGGLFAMALGVAMLMFVSRPVGLFCIACYGFGLGLTIPAANLVVAASNPERRGAALNLLNFSWSVGALVCPFVVAAAAKVDAIRFLLVGIGVFLLVVILGIAAMPASLFENNVPRSDGTLSALPGNLGQRAFLVLSALFFLYVGTENAFGGWIASYAKGLGTSSLSLAVMTPSFFYAALMLGRWIASFVLRKVDEITVARAGLFLAAAGMAGLVFSRTMPLVIASVSAAGLGMAAVYPITISLLSREFGPAAAKVGSIMFTLSNFGGASLPWLVGYFSHQSNDLRVGLTVPFAAALLMYLLYHRQWAAPTVEAHGTPGMSI